MKKLITIFVLLCLVLSNTISVFANSLDNNPYYKKLSINDKKLIKKVEPILDKRFKTLEKKQKLILLLDKKQNSIKSKLNKIFLKKTCSKTCKYKVSKRFARVKNLFGAIKYKLKQDITKLQSKKEEISEDFGLVELVEDDATESLSKTEKEKVEKAIRELQLQVLKKSEKSLDVLIKTYDKYTNFEESGDFSIDLEAKQKDKGEVKAALKLKNLKTKASGLDAQISGDIETSFDVNIKNQPQFKGSIKGFIDYIAKDGNIYLLMKNLNIKGDELIKNINKGLGNSKSLDEILKEIPDNKYLKIEDKNSKKVLEMLKKFTPKRLFSAAERRAKITMLTSSKKIGDKYILEPTVGLCNLAMEITALSSPYITKKTCSDRDIESMKKEFKFDDKGYIYLELGEKENTLGITFKDKNADVDGKVIYNSDTIKKVDFKIIPNQGKHPGESFTFYYKDNSHIKSKLYAEKGKLKYNFDSKLDNDNNFVFIDSKVDIIDGSNKIDGKLILKDTKLEGYFKYYKSKYNYQIRGYGDPELQLSSELNGKVVKNKIEEIKVTLNGAGETFKALLEYNKNLLLFNLDAKSFFASLSTTLKANLSDGALKDGNYNFELKSGNNGINYSLDFKNKKISGGGKINIGNEFIAIKSSGEYDKKYFKYNNVITIPEKFNPNNLYSNQKDKARDTGRTIDMRALKSAVEQYYQDNAEYPSFEEFNNKVKLYAYRIPKDQKAGKEINGCKFGYKYEVGPDKYGIEKGAYRLSTCLESDSYQFKAKNDGGLYDNMYEVGVEHNKKDLKGGYINGITSWEKYMSSEEKSEEKKNLEVNLNIISDLKNSMQKFNFYFDATEGSEKIIKFELDSNLKRVYKDKVDIKEPSNTYGVEEFSKAKAEGTSNINKKLTKYKRKYTVGGYTIKMHNILMNHSIYDKNRKALFLNADLIHKVYPNGNYILCDGVEFLKDGKNVNKEVILKEYKIIDTVGGVNPYDKQIAKVCTVYNGTKKIDSLNNVLIHSYNMYKIKEDLEGFKRFYEFIKKYK